MYSNELCWINPYKLPFAHTDGLYQLIVSDEDIAEAEARLNRFAPFIAKYFPETGENHGLIESPLQEIPRMQAALQDKYGCNIPGRMFLKMDSHLPIAGSVKARGGIYEVLKHAEALCLAAGLIAPNDNYEKFTQPHIREFLGRHSVQVGSTGNLGMSIGIISAALGFRVMIHMSADAKQWKKDLLRSKGVEVIEYSADYSKAVAEGRKNAAADPTSYFIDDEKSVDLFIGYATAAKRLKKQLDEQHIPVDAQHPLIVYIPAGVGGAPGGITYGLKRIFKDHVHCFFAETTTCPSVLIGLDTQTFEQANVLNYGISGKTEADGLACYSPSGFVTRMMTNMVSGEFTVEDAKLYDYLRLLNATEGIQVEPSACAGFSGPCGLGQYPGAMDYCQQQGLINEILQNATQIVWATGGRMVPGEIYEKYLNTYL